MEEGELVHGSPRSPVFEYVLPWDVAYRPTDKVLEIFEALKGLCFVGHTHLPGVITQQYQFLTPQDLPEGRFSARGERALINVGSVGQPRDGDPRSCYVIVDQGEVIYHRVAYKVRRAAKSILKAGLPEKNAARLKKGK
jgi:diadenosine tetraphosphatase ApaH/serine/threonine PP2A family protein phosphatase